MLRELKQGILFTGSPSSSAARTTVIWEPGAFRRGEGSLIRRADGTIVARA